MATITKRKWAEGGGRKDDGRRTGESWQVAWTEDGKRKKKSGFPTRALADSFLIDRQKSIREGLSSTTGDRISLSQLKVEFLKHSRQRAERGVIGFPHIHTMEGHFRNFIDRPTDWRPPRIGGVAKVFEKPIGHLKITKIRASTVNKFRDDLLGAGLSSKHVRAVITTLSQALSYAKDRDYVAQNFAKEIRIEESQAEKDVRVTPPSKALIGKIIASASEDLRLMIQFTACTGVRSGELRALRFRHVNLEARTVDVRVAIKRDDSIGRPKSKAGIRTIPMSPALVQLIREHKTKAEDGGDAALVFPGPDGRVLGRAVLLNRLNKMTSELGLNPAILDDFDSDEDEEGCGSSRFTWHALRHYAISSWIAAGLGIKAVQVFAGHADITTTWNRYGHLFPDEDHWIKMAAACEHVFAWPVSNGANTEQEEVNVH